MLEEGVQLGGARRQWLLASIQVCPDQSNDSIQDRNPMKLLLNWESVRKAFD